MQADPGPGPAALGGQPGAGQLPLARVVNGTCESESRTGNRIVIRGRKLPEGSPVSMYVEFDEPMTKVSNLFCPVVLEEKEKWLAKNQKEATVHVKCTLTRKD